MAAAGGSWKGGGFVPASGQGEAKTVSSQELMRIGRQRYEAADRTTRQYWESNRGGAAGYAANYVLQMQALGRAAARAGA